MRPHNIPGLGELKNYTSLRQYRVFLTVHFAGILLFLCLLILCLLNIYQILWRQRRWRNLSLLTFYLFAFVAIGCRLIWESSQFWPP